MDDHLPNHTEETPAKTLPRKRARPDDRRNPRHNVHTSSKGETPKNSSVNFLDARDDLDQRRPEPVEEVTRIPLEGTEDRFLRIGSHIQDPLRGKLITFLKNNLDVFSWSPADMPGISPTIATHHLNVQPGHKPAKQ
jgi:hypothetical protein